MDGEGYPYHLEGDAIPFTARIIAVADIFQALIQTRPYRNGMSKEEAFDIVDDLRANHQLDASIVSMLEKHLLECYQRACTTRDEPKS